MNVSSERNTTGIIAALGFEARSAQTLAQRGWQVRVSGMGPANARRAAEQMLADGVRRLLVWGTAGGLDAALKPGTLFLPEIVINATDNRRFPVSARWHVELGRALAAPGVLFIERGALITVAQPVMTPADKQELGVRSGALMVDMEAAAVAEAAVRAGAEFAVVRVLLDAAGVPLPQVVISAIDSPHPHRSVMTGLLKRPQDLPAVLRLGRSFRHAHQKLQSVARILTETGLR